MAEGKIDFAQNHWNVITHCERKNAWDETIPAEWFILNGPYATREDAVTHQKKAERDTRGTDADWPEAYAAAKIVHDDELGEYGLKPLNEKSRQNDQYIAPEDTGMSEEAKEQWRYEHGK